MTFAHWDTLDRHWSEDRIWNGVAVRCSKQSAGLPGSALFSFASIIRCGSAALIADPAVADE